MLLEGRVRAGLHATVLAAEFQPALRYDGTGWVRDGARCPLWLSFRGTCPSTLIAPFDPRAFDADCVAAAAYLVSRRYADPSGLWAVKVRRRARRLTWYVCWLGPDDELG